MPRLAFTASALKAFFDKNPRAVAHDTQQRGLCAYMTSTAQITYFAHFRVANRQVKKTIVRMSELPVAEARRKVATASRPAPRRIYKPRRDLNDILVLSKSGYGPSLSHDKAKRRSK